MERDKNYKYLYQGDMWDFKCWVTVKKKEYTDLFTFFSLMGFTVNHFILKSSKKKSAIHRCFIQLHLQLVLWNQSMMWTTPAVIGDQQEHSTHFLGQWA